MDGTLKTGERIVERKLAAQFGASLAVVREAIIQLEAEGFITKWPNTSTHVTRLSLAETEKIFAVRKVLEGFAVEEAARLVYEAMLPTPQICWPQLSKRVGAEL